MRCFLLIFILLLGPALVHAGDAPKLSNEQKEEIKSPVRAELKAELSKQFATNVLQGAFRQVEAFQDNGHILQITDAIKELDQHGQTFITKLYEDRKNLDMEGAGRQARMLLSNDLFCLAVLVKGLGTKEAWIGNEVTIISSCKEIEKECGPDWMRQTALYVRFKVYKGEEIAVADILKLAKESKVHAMEMKVYWER